jgi:glyoxalase/bleomycin resistance protein/dioxygenase superfamily protein
MSAAPLVYPNLHHVGVVVRDMDEAAKDDAVRFGLSHIVRRCTMHVDGALYRGRRVSYSAEVGFVELGNLAIEVIQPIGNDASPYRDALAERGETTHHLAFVVPSIERHLEMARTVNAPVSVVLDAPLPGGRGRFTYVAGLVHGALIELIEFESSAPSAEQPP